MKIAFLGDSITECQGGYVDMIGEKLGCQILNYGIGGTRIAKQDIKSEEPRCDKDFLSRLESIDVSADLLFVFGCVNDYMHGEAPFGDTDDKSDYTFCGAVNKLIKLLLVKFGKNRLCFILPYKTYQSDKPNKHGKTLKEYVNQIRSVLDKYDIDYINLLDNVFEEPTSNQEEEYILDGIHPTLLGYKVIADTIIEYINKSHK